MESSLIGIIVSITKDKSGTIIEIDKKTFLVPTDIFIYAYKGDAIHITYNSDVNTVISTPIIYPCTNTKKLIGILTKGLTRVKVPYIEALSYMKELVNASFVYCNDETSLSKYLTIKASMYHKTHDAEIPQLLCGGDNPKASKHILEWWIRNFLYRRLYCLGLNNKMIDDVLPYGYNLDSLYTTLTQTPLSCIELDIEKRKEIIQQLGLSDGITSFDRMLSNVLNRIHLFTVSCGYSCLSMDYILYKFSLPNNEMARSRIESYYKCKYITIDQGDEEEPIEYFLLGYQYRAAHNINKFISEARDNEKSSSEEMPNIKVQEDDIKSLDETQKECIDTLLKTRIGVVYGKAGTGKTRILLNLFNILRKNKINTYIVSFTGKAVSRIKEFLNNSEDLKEDNKDEEKGGNAKIESDYLLTIHMFVKIVMSEGIYHSVGAVIIDEASMVSSLLLSSLVKVLVRCRPDVRLYLVGDPNQIQPIGFGCPFNAFLNEQMKLTTVFLQYDYRRDSDSTINTCLDSVINGNMPKSIGDDFGIRHVPTDKIHDAIKKLAKLYHEIDVPITNVTVLCPQNKYLPEINQIFINEYLNLSRGKRDSFGNTWYLNQRVMMTDNSYEIHVMNGEEGMIIDLCGDEHKIIVKFGKNECVVNTKDKESKEQASGAIDMSKYRREKKQISTRMLENSNGLTVHKSQGSEWKYLIFYIPDVSEKSSFIDKSIIYTGCSRAQERLDLLYSCTKERLEKMIKKEPREKNDIILCYC